MKSVWVMLGVGLWLLFFSNAPYIVIDLFHLKQKHNIPIWFDTVLISSAAWNGLILGYLSIHEIQVLKVET